MHLAEGLTSRTNAVSTVGRAATIPHRHTYRSRSGSGAHFARAGAAITRSAMTDSGASRMSQTPPTASAAAVAIAGLGVAPLHRHNPTMPTPTVHSIQRIGDA